MHKTQSDFNTKRRLVVAGIGSEENQTHSEGGGGFHNLLHYIESSRHAAIEIEIIDHHSQISMVAERPPANPLLSHKTKSIVQRNRASARVPEVARLVSRYSRALQVSTRRDRVLEQLAVFFFPDQTHLPTLGSNKAFRFFLR
jgi:hypothetical protein